MNRREIREFTFLMLFIFVFPIVLTFVHELSHALVCVFYNLDVKEIMVNPLGGGHIVHYFDYINYTIMENGRISTIICFAGGLGVCLFSLRLAVVDKNFLYVAFVGLMDGFAEMLMLPDVRLVLWYALQFAIIGVALTLTIINGGE